MPESNKMKPLVSVCIPTYNGVKYIQDCLDSVLSQTFSEFELLIVDDCSTDATLELIKAYALKDQRIRVVVNPNNLGLVGNWNRCVELARGEWIKFVFQDDLIEPECLEQMLAAGENHRGIVVSRRCYLFAPNIPPKTQQAYLRDIQKFSLETIFKGTTKIAATDYAQAVLEYLGHNFVGEPTGVMLHKSLFSRFGLFNPYLISACDFEFWTRVAIQTGIIYVPSDLTRFRIHDDSQSSLYKSNRHYRAWVLDPLILLHDFSFNPVYKPLRTVAIANSSNNLANLLADKAYEAKKMAQKAATRAENPDPNLLTEWENLLKLYPLLGQLSQRSLSKRIVVHISYRWLQLQRQANKWLKS